MRNICGGLKDLYDNAVEYVRKKSFKGTALSHFIKFQEKRKTHGILQDDKEKADTLLHWTNLLRRSGKKEV